jgi:3-phenylpropionate/trans-cinnamate dioxygenase ferredoxin component
MLAFKRIAVTSDLEDGMMKQYDIDNRQILVVRLEGQFYAINALCTHAVGYLEDGELVGFEVFCPLHAGAFDIRTGAPTRLPAAVPLACYPIKIEGDDVLVGLETT